MLSAGLNYHLQDENSRGLNLYGGIEHSIWKYFSVAFEVNPNINDKNGYVWKDKKSLMLNGVLRVAPTEGMIIEVQFIDLLTNSRDAQQIGRCFGVNFISKFI